MNNKVLIKSIVVLVAICLVISAALALVNSVTAPIIEQASIERENVSRQNLLPEAADFEAISSDVLPPSITGAYRGVDAAGSPMGYVFTCSNQGFNGKITVMAAIGMDGKIVKVATMDVTSETATLGGLTAKESYTAQYSGKDASLNGVEAVSGATITSRGYEQCIHDCFAAYDAVKEG